MSAATCDAPARELLRPSARTLGCLATVLAGHVAVLALLGSGERPALPSRPAVTVTLLAPEETAPSAAQREPAAAQPVRAAPKPTARTSERPARPQRAKPSGAPPAAPAQRVPAAPAQRAAEPAAAETQAAPSSLPQAASPLPEPEAGTTTAQPEAQAAPPSHAPALAESGASAGSAGKPSPAPEPVVPPRFDAAYLENPAPEYPRLARRLGEQGTVLLEVYVTADGSPERIRLHKSSGSPRLDEAARETVKRWKFVPARQGDRPVGAWIVVPIRFVLEG